MPDNTLSTRVLFPLLFVFLWSTGFIGAKYGLPYVEPFTFLLVRMVIVAFLMLIIAFAFRARWPTRPALYVHASVVGVLIHGIYLGGVFFAISRGLDAGISALIVSLQPLLTVVLSVAFLAEASSARKNTGILLGLIGVLMVIVSGIVTTGEPAATQGITATGIATCVIGLVSISVGTVYQKRYCSDMDLLTGACIQYLAVSVFLLGMALRFETMQILWTPQLIFALAWLVLALSCGAVLLLMWLLQRGDAGSVASLFYLVPPFTAIEAWLLFDEQLGWIAWTGMAICALGVALVTGDRQTRSG